MKFGSRLGELSVPEWRLHNVDYNSLKREIKLHTCRDRASAIVIPGQQDPARLNFEHDLYRELCNQHDRVQLFVNSKADEISRRLEHTAKSVQTIIIRFNRDTDAACFRRQRKLAKHERAVLECGHEIVCLVRFVNAQDVAFRKILKKYKKWTGSNTVGVKFKENVLGNPKSFIRRDFSVLQSRHDDVLAAIHSVAPSDSEPTSPTPSDRPATSASSQTIGESNSPCGRPHNPSTNTKSVTFDDSTVVPSRYWNEYEDGSEAGDVDDEYMIYINPDEEVEIFPGLSRLCSMVTLPIRKLFAKPTDTQSPDCEQAPLLDPSSRRSSIAPTVDSDSETEVDSPVLLGATRSLYPTYGSILPPASSSTNPPFNTTLRHHHRHHNPRSNAVLYRQGVLFWTTVGFFVASFVLFAGASLLIATGRHRMRIEVDVGVTIGALGSLLCGLAGVGTGIFRRQRPGWPVQLAIWVTFAAICVLNSMLLTLVAGNMTLD